MFLVHGKDPAETAALPPVGADPEPTRVVVGSGETETIAWRRAGAGGGSAPGPEPSRPRPSRAPLYAAIAASVVALIAVGVTLAVASSAGDGSAGTEPASRPAATSSRPAADRRAAPPSTVRTTSTTIATTTTTTTTAPTITTSAPRSGPVSPDTVRAIDAVYAAIARHDWPYVRANFVNGAGVGPQLDDGQWDAQYGTLREHRLVPRREVDGTAFVGLLTHEVDAAGTPFSWEFCLAFRVGGTHVQQVGAASDKARVDGEWVDFDEAEATVQDC